MNFLNHIKTTILFLLTVLLGTQTTHAKTEFILCSLNNTLKFTNWVEGSVSVNGTNYKFMDLGISSNGGFAKFDDLRQAANSGDEVLGKFENLRYLDEATNQVKKGSFKICKSSDDVVYLAQEVGKSDLLAKLISYPNVSKVVNRLDEVSDASLLSKIDDLATNNPSKLNQLEDLYSPSKFKLPLNRPTTNGIKKNGDFTIQKTINGENISVYYNKAEFPDFTPFSPGNDYIFFSNTLSGTSSDMTLANNFLLNKFTGNPNKFKWNGQTTWFEIKNSNGDWIKYTWHHVEDGRTMIPIPSKIHNATSGGFSHTGGKAIIIRQLQDFFNY